MVSTVRVEGAPRRQCAEDGAALHQAHRTKEHTHPELTGEQLVVLACDTGGASFEQLARGRARSEPTETRRAARRASESLRTRARQSWVLRWGSILV